MSKAWHLLTKSACRPPSPDHPGVGSTDTPSRSDEAGGNESSNQRGLVILRAHASRPARWDGANGSGAQSNSDWAAVSFRQETWDRTHLPALWTAPSLIQLRKGCATLLSALLLPPFSFLKSDTGSSSHNLHFLYDPLIASSLWRPNPLTPPCPFWRWFPNDNISSGFLLPETWWFLERERVSLCLS